MQLASKPKHVVDNLLRLHSYALGTEEERRFHFDRVYNAEHQVYYHTSEGAVFAPVKWCGARQNCIAHYPVNKTPISQVFQRALSKVGFRQLTENESGYDAIYAEFLRFCNSFGFKHSSAGVPHSDSRPRTFWSLSFPKRFEKTFPDEVQQSGTYPEGATKQVRVNAYERSSAARLACIAHYGWACQVCGVDFEQRYGTLGGEFIHVHHVSPLSGIGKEYRVNPITDLRPVCPNCHAMLHREEPPLTVEFLKSMLLSS